MTSPISKILTSLSLLFVTACGAARNGDYGASTAGAPTPRLASLWQGREVRRWVQVAAGPDSSIWPALEVGLTRIHPAQALEGHDSTMAAMGTLAGLPNLVFVLVEADTRLSPVGPAGSSVALTAGTHVLRRWSTADQPNNFEEIAPPEQMGASVPETNEAYYGIDPYVPASGLPYSPKLELGRKVGELPAGSGRAALPVTDLAWAPTSDAVVLLAGTIGFHDVELLKYSSGASTLARSAKGDYTVPLEVGMAGRVLVNQVSWSDDLDTGNVKSSAQRLSLAWQGAVPGSVAILPLGDLPTAGTQPLDVISPDGTILAYGRSDGRIDLIDLASNTVLPASPGNGLPLAWDPSGQRLLVLGNGQIMWLGLDGTQEWVTSIAVLGRFQPAQGRQDRVLVGASGPKLLRQDADGTQLVDLLTGSSIRFVEPDRVAAPGAMLGFVAATDQVFAWAVQCLGLGETACTSELRRLTIATGTVDVVARADGSLPFAVSPDGNQLAIVLGDGLYLKTIAPQWLTQTTVASSGSRRRGCDR